jgi:hypothetical protein
VDWPVCQGTNYEKDCSKHRVPVLEGNDGRAVTFRRCWVLVQIDTRLSEAGVVLIAPANEADSIPARKQGLELLLSPMVAGDRDVLDDEKDARCASS